jgi:hypothetical protein
MLHRNARDRSAQIEKGREQAKKGGRHVAMAALSLGRKRPRRAYAAGHAAPQQYRRCPRPLQVFSLPCGRLDPQIRGTVAFLPGSDKSDERQITTLYQ